MVSEATSREVDRAWRSSDLRRRLRVILAQCFAKVDAPAVALVKGGSEHPVEGLLRSTFPGARLTTIRARADDLHLGLAAGGPFDVVIDLAGGRRSGRRFATCFYHLRPGGTLVMRLPKRGTQGDRHDLHALLEDLDASRRSGTTARSSDPSVRAGSTRAKDTLSLATAIETLEVGPAHVVAVSCVHALAKVPEREVNHLLRSGGAKGLVIETVPGSTWDSRSTVRASAPAWLERLPRTYHAPELSLREYDDVHCRPAQVAIQDNLVLPESYRHHFSRRLRNRAVVELAPDFVAAPDLSAPVLPGQWFYLDNEFRGHFGHALTDQISHLWGWAAAKARYPDLRALVFLNKGRELAGWEYDLYGAAGVEREDLVLLRDPVRVETLVTASPAFSMPRFVHPVVGETYDHIGRALAERAETRNRPERIFASRRRPKRRCHNAEEVEEFFRCHDFQIVYPEDLPLPEQVALFRSARIIAGFAGSGMFHVGFAGEPKHVIQVSSDSYTAQNEYMLSSVVGHRLDLALCRADVPLGDRFSAAAYQSDFTFDAAREGRFLERVLGEG